MLKKAYAYMDKQLIKEMKELKKRPKTVERRPTINALRYMYVAALADRKLSGEAKEAAIGIAGGIGEGLIIKNGEVYKKVPESELLESLRYELLHWK